MQLESILTRIKVFTIALPSDYGPYEDWFHVCRTLAEQGDHRAHIENRELRARVASLLSRTQGDAEKAHLLYGLYRRSLLLDAPVDLDAYMLYLEWNRDPAKKFYQPRREVLFPLIRDLQALGDGDIDFLGVSLPPRVGKSTACIFFLSWWMGKHPDTASVMSGHSDKLTDGFYREILSILTDRETYLWGDVFPGVFVADSSAKNETIDLKRAKRFPTFTARSIGGTLTGAVEIGEKGILYCDDLVEDLEEALNPLRLQAKYDAYLNQLKDRKKDGARELMIGTRWNVMDPLGKIEDQYQDNPRFRFRVIPALNEQDESNFDYPYGVGFSTKYYHDMRASIDDATWWAKYMGQPYVREGLLFPEKELRRYFELPQGEPDAVLAICDTKDRGADYAFLPVVYQYGLDFYIEDCVCDNGLPEVVDARLISALVQHRVKLCRFESNSAGGRIAEKVQAGVKERGGITHITTRYTTANKETKIIVNSPWVKTHCLFKDASCYARNSEYGRMMQMLCTYTMAGKNPHDDVPDGLAMLAEFVQSLSRAKVQVFERPI